MAKRFLSSVCCYQINKAARFDRDSCATSFASHSQTHFNSSDVESSVAKSFRRTVRELRGKCWHFSSYLARLRSHCNQELDAWRESVMINLNICKHLTFSIPTLKLCLGEVGKVVNMRRVYLL